MEATIVSFRRGRHVQKGNHMIVNAAKIDSKEKAVKLVGKEAVWKSPAGRETKGKVAAAHGNSGALRIIFEKGMPGQSLTGKVEIKE